MDNNSFYDDKIVKIINFNIGKKVVICLSFNSENNNKEFNGIIEKCENDYIILSDPTSGNWYLFLIKYINYIKFEEEINFNH